MSGEDRGGVAPTREGLKSTLSVDKVTAARKERRNADRKKRKREHLNSRRRLNGNDDDELTDVVLPQLQQQPNFSQAPVWDLAGPLPSQLVPVIRIQVPAAWSREKSTIPLQEMDAAELVRSATNEIMCLMPNFSEARPKILAIIDAVVTHKEVVFHLAKDDTIFGVREPPLECLEAVHKIIQACDYTNINAWMFLMALLSGMRNSRHWFRDLEQSNPVQVQYDADHRARICAYVNQILAPEISKTLLVTNHGASSHICAGCKVLAFLFDDYLDDDLVTQASAAGNSIQQLLFEMCNYGTNGILDAKIHMFESDGWFDVMSQLKKIATWFGALVKKCSVQKPTPSADGSCPPQYIALGTYQSTAAYGVLTLAQTLAYRNPTKTKIRTFHLAIWMLGAALPVCAHMEKCDVDDYYRAAIDLIQTTPYHADKDLRGDFFDFLVLLTEEKFDAAYGDQALVYHQMYENIANVAEAVAKIMATNPIAANELEGRFADIRWNLAMDYDGLDVLSNFAAYPFLFKLSASQFVGEFGERTNLMLRGQTTEPDIILGNLSKFSVYVTMLIRPLHHKLRILPYKREPTVVALNAACDADVLAIFRDFVTSTGVLWGIITGTSYGAGFIDSISPETMFALSNTSNKIACEISKRRHFDCTRHLTVVHEILRLYDMLLRDPSIPVVEKCIEFLPNLPALDQTMDLAIQRVGRPTHEQAVSDSLHACKRQLEALRVSLARGTECAQRFRQMNMIM